jgi:hypothetical protein
MDPAFKGKRKVDDLDPDFCLIEEDTDDEEDHSLQTQRRKRIRSATSQLTIGDLASSGYSLPLLFSIECCAFYI